jgi:hypothetical protein
MLANVSRGAEKAVIKDFEERVELPLELAAAVLFLSSGSALNGFNAKCLSTPKQHLIMLPTLRVEECVQVRVEGFLPIWSADDRTRGL